MLVRVHGEPSNHPYSPRVQCLPSSSNSSFDRLHKSIAFRTSKCPKQVFSSSTDYITGLAQIDPFRIYSICYLSPRILRQRFKPLNLSWTGPHQHPKLPPPVPGTVRLTCLNTYLIEPPLLPATSNYRHSQYTDLQLLL